MKQRFVLAALVAILSAAMLLIPLQHSLQAQVGATIDLTAIEKILAPRQTLTAIQVNAQLQTIQANVTSTAGAVLTSTFYALTSTATPSITFTPSSTVSPSPFIPTATLDQTQVRDQINTAVWRAVTQTQEGLVNGTATVEIQQTVNAIINGNAAATPINGIPMTATPTPTPTFNETQVAAQLKTAVSAALTQTQDGLINQTATVAFQQTVEAVLHGIGTATAVAKRAALSQGLSPITAANARQLKSILTLQGKAGAIQDAVFDPTGAVIASVASDKTVRLWDTLTGNQLKQIPGLTNRTSLAFSSDGAYLAVASSDATVRVLNTTTGAEAAVLHEQPLTQGSVVGAIRSIAFSPNGQWLASGGDDKVVRLWRVSPGSAGQPTQFASDAQVLKGHFGAVNTVSFSPDSKVLVSGSQDASIILWEVSSGGQITILRDQQQVLSVAYNSDGTLLASGGTGRSIQVWDLSTGKSRIVLRWLNGITKTPSAINALAFGQDSSIIVGGGQDGPDIGVWDVAAGVNLAVLRGHTGPISSLAFSPDGVRLISGSADQTINVWGIPAK